MLVFKAAQVLVNAAPVSKDWEFEGKKGTSHYVDVTCLGEKGAVAVIRFKAKTPDEAAARASVYKVGKAAEIPVVGVEDGARGVMVLNA